MDTSTKIKLIFALFIWSITTPALGQSSSEEIMEEITVIGEKIIQAGVRGDYYLIGQLQARKKELEFAYELARSRAAQAARQAEQAEESRRLCAGASLARTRCENRAEHTLAEQIQSCSSMYDGGSVEVTIPIPVINGSNISFRYNRTDVTSVCFEQKKAENQRDLSDCKYDYETTVNTHC